jgi:hypothetical protein
MDQEISLQYNYIPQYHYYMFFNQNSTVYVEIFANAVKAISSMQSLTKGKNQEKFPYMVGSRVALCKFFSTYWMDYIVGSSHRHFQSCSGFLDNHRRRTSHRSWSWCCSGSGGTERHTDQPLLSGCRCLHKLCGCRIWHQSWYMYCREGEK